MNHEVHHFSGGSNYPMWLKWADFPLSIVCLLLLPFCDLGESRQWHMLPVCGFGPYQLAEADLDRSQNKQSVGGNSYTSDSTLFQGQCLTHTQHAEQLQLHLALFFFCLRFWPHGPGAGTASGSPSGRKWRGQRRPALQPWVKRHVQMKVWAWCWWVTLTHYSSKTFCSVTSAILGSAPHPQNKEPESRSQPEPLCQFLFLLNVRLSLQHFSPDLILSHRRGFPLVRVGDDVTP